MTAAAAAVQRHESVGDPVLRALAAVSTLVVTVCGVLAIGWGYQLNGTLSAMHADLANLSKAHSTMTVQVTEIAAVNRNIEGRLIKVETKLDGK